MAINKKLIHFKNFSTFNTKKLSANENNTQYTVGVNGAIVTGTPEILYQSIVWIKDTKQQWTHGQLYDCKEAISESTVSGWGFTKNEGTITGITMNGVSKGSSGVVDLGTVITQHQDISGKADTDALANYLPLTGGELSGSLKVNGVVQSTSYIIPNGANQYSATATADIFTAFKQVVFGNTGTSPKIKTFRGDSTTASGMGTPPDGYKPIIGNYSAILAFTDADTHGFIGITPKGSNLRVQVGGGSAQAINWTADLVHSINVGDYALPISGGTVTDQVKFRHGANRTTPQVVIGGNTNNTLPTLELETTDGKSAWQFSLRNRSTDSKELMLYRGANYANQWRIDYATGKMIQYGDLEVRGTLVADTVAGATPIPVINTTATTQAISPNKMYVWSEAPTSLVITLDPPTNSSIVNEYLMEFPIYNTTISLPSNIVWANDNAPTFNNGSVLQLSIVNNKGVWTEFKNVYTPPTYTVDGTFYKDGTSDGNTVYFSNGAGIATITINGYDTFTVYVRHSNGYNDNVENEGEYDYMVVGNLDATITASSVTGSTGVKYTTQGMDTPEGTVDIYDITQYQSVTFSGIGGGQHTIMIAYHKDSQFDVGEDSGYILISE